jgi:hypothetical protein
MTRAEWIEVLAIAALAATSWLVWPGVSAVLPLWEVTLGLSALLLAHSLVRDIAILLRSRRSASTGLQKEAHCFCLESTAGSIGIVAGMMLACFAGSTQVEIRRWGFSMAVTGIMILGFFVKDLVISWSPFGVRRETDHLNLIVRWRSKAD